MKRMTSAVSMWQPLRHAMFQDRAAKSPNENIKRFSPSGLGILGKCRLTWMALAAASPNERDH